jgi:GNAT superfamily N-acetyltransferase
VQSLGNKWRSYIRESYNRQVFEHDHGFATYSIIGMYCIIHDMYVEPEFRNSKVGSEMANHIKVICSEEGCTKMACTIDKRSKTYKSALKAITEYGFKVIDNEGLYTTLERDI